jgi:Nucleotide modification associated domain 1
MKMNDRRYELGDQFDIVDRVQDCECGCGAVSITHRNTQTTTEFALNVWNVMDGAGNVLISKHQDYGPKNISQSPGGPLNGLRVRMWDKIARINNLIDSGKTPENESLKDSFLDLLNYSAIALMVIEGKWPQE